MVAAGEATTDGAGRYRLAGHLAARQIAPVGQPRRRDGPDYDGSVVAGRRDDHRQHGRGARRPAPRPRLRPAGRAARGRLDAPGQRRRARCPTPSTRDVELMTADPDRTRGAGRPALGPRAWSDAGPATSWTRLDAADTRRPRGAGAGIRALGGGAPAPAGRPVAPRRAAAAADWPGARAARDLRRVGRGATAPRWLRGAGPPAGPFSEVDGARARTRARARTGGLLRAHRTSLRDVLARALRPRRGPARGGVPGGPRRRRRRASSSASARAGSRCRCTPRACRCTA